MSDTSEPDTRYTAEGRHPPGQNADENSPLEGRLDQGEEQFRAFFELSAVGVVQYDVSTGRFLRANDAFCRIIGYSAAELLGMTFVELTHPDEREPNWARFREAMRAGSPNYVVEKRFLRKDGAVIWARLNVGFIRDGGGRPTGAGAVVEDFTERRRAEELLRASEGRLSALLESVQDYAIFTLDTEGRIRSWNPGAERAFGYTGEEVRGQHTRIIFTPEDRERGVPEAEMKTAREKGKAADERWHVSKRGVRFYVSGVNTPLRDGDGRLIGYVKIARDQTERKEMEEALRRAHDELEERVRGRTLELAEANVSLQEEVRERAAAETRLKQLLRQLITVQEEERRRIARELHDTLGRQLAALHLSIEMIKAESEGRARLLGHVGRTRAIFERLDSNLDFLAWELRPAALDQLGLDAALQTFVREWSEQFGVAADYRGPDLNAPRMTPEVETNLYRILQEALQNVHKHAGATHVSVILERRDRRAALIVEDNGQGYDADAEEAAGTNKGMGVTNMRERAALLGGELEVESAPGRDHLRARARRRARRGRGRRVSVTKVRVLIAEDHRTMRAAKATRRPPRGPRWASRRWRRARPTACARSGSRTEPLSSITPSSAAGCRIISRDQKAVLGCQAGRRCDDT